MAKKKNRNKIKRENVKVKSRDFGQFTVKEFGRNTIYQANKTQQEHLDYINKLKDAHPKIKESINSKIVDTINLIENYNPFFLLQRIVFENQILDLETYKESTEEGFETYIEYAQSLIVSCNKFGWDNKPDEEILKNFSNLIKEIVNETVSYFGTEFAENYSEEIDFQKEAEIRFKSISSFIYVRGDSYESHDEEMIDALLENHSDFFMKHYSLTYLQLKKAIHSIKHSIESTYFSQNQAMPEITKAYEIFCNFIESQPESLTELESIAKFQKIPEIVEIQKKAKEMQSQNDYMIITPDENIPQEFLELLSTNLGSNDTFKEFNKCWPINDTIIKNKPLIKHKDKYYCFFYPLLGRNIRYILENMIKSKDPKYFNEYYLKRGRDVYLENKSAEYLQVIFPKSMIHQNLKYRINKQMFETDIIVEFDRNLFIVEAKASSLSLSSKRGSLKALEKDTKKILRKAYQQALRTRDYIKSNNNAIFVDQRGAKIVIDKSNYDNIYLMNVTLDKLDFLSTELSDMDIFGLTKSDDWFWSVFLNDLRVISDLVEMPSIFLLYLNRRLQAFENQFYSPDELDYFMFFLKQGLYFEKDDLIGINKFIPYGYTDELDRYYFHKEGSVSSGDKPLLKLSDRFKDLVRSIESSNKAYCSIISYSLLSMNEESRLDILNNLDRIKHQLDYDMKSHSFTLPFTALNIGFIFYIANSENDYNHNSIEKYCRIKMNQCKINKWVAIRFVQEISFKNMDYYIYFNNESDETQIIEDVEKFKANKITNYFKNHKKIGRNDLCPCGSGKKYKKCCGKIV